jgi:hypothetical protein
MNVQLLLLIAVTFLGAGCCCIDRDKTERSHSIRSGYPVSAQFVPLRRAGTPVNCPGSGAASACVIPVTVTDESCDADKIVLEEFVNLGDIAQKKRVVWTLPAQYVFCPRAGDGVFLKDPLVPEDIFEPKPTKRCSDTFEWKREKSNPDNPADYEYLLRCRTTSNVCCGVQEPGWRI